MKYNPLVFCTLALLSLIGSQLSTVGQGTAFTYQGRLLDNGAPATGSYDLQFTVYDLDTGGNVIAGPIASTSVAVTNGLFTTTLDFGADVFTGEPRWLEIGVVTNGGETYEILSPLQPLLPTPYAMFAAKSANVGSGAVVKNLNGLLDDVTLEAGANVTITPNGNALTIDSVGAGGSGIWNLSDSNAYFNTGNVGIGTSIPTTPLAIQTGTGYYGFTHTDGITTVGSYVGSSSSGASGGWLGTRSNHPLHLFVNNGQPTLSLDLGGRVGIGTSTPATKLTVKTSANPYGIEHTDGNVRLSTYLDASFGAWLGTRSPHALNFFVHDGLPSLTIDLAGMVHVKTLSITGGADVAEPFAMAHEELPPGSVVVIDSEHPGKLKLSTDAYDTRVAGIVSGANGIKPGIALHQEGVAEGGQNVALSGRVYVQADASYGAIAPGDLLTTSDTPGHAMKVTHHAKAQGAILGKAMSGLKEGKGFVLVLVTLQ